MGIDDGVRVDEYEMARWNEARILEIVSRAKREYPDKTCPVSQEDFFDIHRNGPGYLTVMNEKYCGRYFRHHQICMDQEFVCVTEDDFGVIL
jgi:hypothetical protein